MNTPNNKRKRESMERIEKVFIQLLQGKELDEISVSELCKHAGLNRTTFYANYTDIYGLADAIRDKLEIAVSALYNDEISQGYNSNDYLKLFRHIKENQIVYQTYFKLGYDNNYKIIRYDTALAREHFQNQFIEYHMEYLDDLFIKNVHCVSGLTVALTSFSRLVVANIPYSFAGDYTAVTVLTLTAVRCKRKPSFTVTAEYIP